MVGFSAYAVSQIKPNEKTRFNVSEALSGDSQATQKRSGGGRRRNHRAGPLQGPELKYSGGEFWSGSGGGASTCRLSEMARVGEEGGAEAELPTEHTEHNGEH